MADDLQILPLRWSLRSPTARDIAAVFFRHKRLLAHSFVAVASLGMLYGLLFPSYRAEMDVLVRRGRIDPAITPTPSPSPAFEHDEVTEEELNSEVELLRDEDVLRQVVLETNLAPASWWSRLTLQSSEVRTEKAIRRLARSLDVQPIRKSRIIKTSYSSSRARLSAAVLRSLEHWYIAKHAEIRRPVGQQTFFEEQEAMARHALEQAQAGLIAFTQREGVVSAEMQRDLLLRKLSDAEAANSELKSETASARERAVWLDSKLRELPERRVAQIKNADNPDLQGKLKSKLLELQLRRTELLTKFQPSYRLVQEIDQQIVDAKEAIDTENHKPLRDETTENDPEHEWAYSERLKSQAELAGLRRKESVTRTQIAEYLVAAQKLEERAIVQRDLEQKLKSAEEKWLLYSNKREEARIGDALDQNGVLNVAISQQPHVPALPTWSFLAASCVSLLGACGFSTAVVFAADYFDPSFRTPDEVLAVLGSPVLVSLPARTVDSHRHPEAS